MTIPYEELKKHKVDVMLSMRKQGIKLRVIGSVFGISRERVRQLVGNTGYYRIPFSKRGYRKEEILAVKEHLHASNEEIARLYYFPYTSIVHYLFGKTGRVQKYPDGFRKCYGHCHKVLPVSSFYNATTKRCISCARLKARLNYKHYGPYALYVRGRGYVPKKILEIERIEREVSNNG